MQIVGIGASAGGLVALERFFAQASAQAGLAYVVVQHLDPTQKAVLAQLLQRVTTLPVCEASAEMVIEPNRVYVIAPNTELSINRGHLQLDKPSEPRGMRLPINVLLSSLARDQGAAAIGVVLSGMGSDGTLGLQAIKAVGGLTLAQTPTSAQFDAMPRSAIAAECVDIVTTPDEMPARISSFTARATTAPDAPSNSQDADKTWVRSSATTMQDIFSLLQQHTRHDFSLYKNSTLQRRIDRRMAIHGLSSLVEYADFLRLNTQEVDLLFKELLIGVTSFFRDQAVWQFLKDKALPSLLDKRAEDTVLRAWVVGCSTGEEAYTLAMIFTEAVESHPAYRDHRLQIFASDLSADAIATARAGRYPRAISGGISPERVKRFFTVHDDTLLVNKAIRDMVMFAQHDVVLDPPFTKLDILCCRNLLIYFDATLQRRLLPLFHYSLRQEGVLVLGSSESVGSFNLLFEPTESTLRVYRRQPHASSGSHDLLLKSFPPLSRPTKDSYVPLASSLPQAADSLQTAADHVLLQVHAPPAVVLNGGGDIVYISGRTGKYLEPAAGKANWNFHAMVRESLRASVAEAINKAMSLGETVNCRSLPLTTPSGMPALVDVTIQPLREPATLRGMVMVVFRDVAPPPKPGRRKAASAQDAAHAAELQQFREEIQSLREEARTSKEELQSANEELTTSKEEMQSMNEELQTVNAEMQTKLDDLALAQSDMKNLLNSTDIAMLFLDQNLNVRRYTERATKIINLRDSDIGRPLSDLTTTLQYPALHEDAQETLRTLVFSEKQISTSDQRWFSVKVMPYRRLDNVIDGAVITFVDITATKELESRLRLTSES